MANSFLSTGRNIPFLNAIRRLSSFNNNRARLGVASVVNNDDLSIWSENNWSEFAKQIGKPSDFALPGRTGMILESKKCKTNKIKQLTTNENKNLNIQLLSENLEHILVKPLPQENQIIRLKEAAGAFYYEDKMEKQLFSNEDTVKHPFELKANKCPVSLVKDFQNYFRSNSLGEQQLTVITVSFKTENDMATWNNDVDSEREVIMKKFVDTAQELCCLLEKEGFWADYIDPSSGRPYKSPFTYATFYETDERYRQLGFEIVDYGCCKVISHHKWGSKTYVGCVLTNANINGKTVKELTERNS